jgi:hypothetical protein
MKKIYLLASFLYLSAPKINAQVNLNFGLIAQYNFTDESLDDSGPNFISLINNNGANAVSDRFGNPLSAYQFDGIDDYLSASNEPVLTLGNGATISMWINLNDVNTNQKLIGKLTTPPITMDGGYLIGVENGQVHVETWDVGSVAYGFLAGSLTANQWTNIAVTYQFQSYAVLYINGVAIDSVFAPDGIGANSNDLIIGAAPWDPSFFKTEGVIDDIKIYNRKVNTAEIAAIYNEVITGASNINKDEFIVANNAGLINIIGKNQQKLNRITLNDISGKVTYDKTFNNQQNQTLDLTMLPKGIYFARIYTNNGIQTIKLFN